MIWLHWSTYSQGTGGFNHQGHVILSLSKNKWQEIFRHNFMSYSRGGWWHYSTSSLDISYEEGLRLLKLVFSNEEFFADHETTKVFTTLEVDDADDSTAASRYSYTLADKTILAYEFSNETLNFKYGYKAFDTAKNRFQPQALAQHFQTTVAELQRLNPTQRQKKYFSGQIVVTDHAKPLATDNYDGLNGGL
jgi:hypothetical protein